MPLVVDKPRLFQDVYILYAPNVPNVNKVCFCLPLTFFPFWPASSAGVAAPLGVLSPEPDPVPQAGAAGPALFPMMFFKETFPFVLTFSRGAALGSSGNNALDSFGGALLGPTFRVSERGSTTAEGGGPVVTLGGGKADGAGGLNPDEELDAHGVFLCPPGARRTGAGPAIGIAGGGKAGNAPGREEEAARATLSHTWPAD